MKRILAVVALLGGCANVHVNRATLIASTAALGADWALTRGMASRDWKCGPGSKITEQNAVLGEAPSVRSVDGYFVATLAINTALWLALPKRYKSLVPISVIAAEGLPIYHHAAVRAEFCGGM